jgi:hypothetical protein
MLSKSIENKIREAARMCSESTWGELHLLQPEEQIYYKEDAKIFTEGAHFGYQLASDEKESEYDRGFLDGSKVGDATAKRFKEERDSDMDRLQSERVEIYKSKQSLQSENARLKDMLDVAVNALEWMYEKRAVTIFIEDEMHVKDFFSRSEEALTKIRDGMGEKYSMQSEGE